MSIDVAALEFLRCPVSGQRLMRSQTGEDVITTLDGRYSYRVLDGIFIMLPDHMTNAWTKEKTVVQNFYDSFGWEQSDTGEYNDTRLFGASGEVGRQYTRKCLLALREFLPPHGRYLLDAGSGPIPHPEHMSYHEHFDRRVCVDFSFPALVEAKRKLGARGIYIMGDVTALPIADGAMQAVVCCHVLYHVPAGEQHRALNELARVLEKGGRGIVVYKWAASPLSRSLNRVFDLLSMFVGRPAAAADSKKNPPALYAHPQPRKWFLGSRWPFRHRLACFRLIDGASMKKYMTEARPWRLITSILFIWQTAMPRFTGKYGLYPIIIIEK
jgi:SAM-dependent methyltransferase